jgi:Fe-S-cluster containining protein
VPGQVEKVAEYLDVPLEQLFKSKLAVDWLEHWDGDIFLLAPATTKGKPGQEYSGDPRGRCVFLTDDDRCAIHPAKPRECAELDHTSSDADIDKSHHDAGYAWDKRKHQKQIRKLLGREPSSATWNRWWL